MRLGVRFFRFCHYSYDYVSFFAPGFYIPARLDGSFEGILSVDIRLAFFSINQHIEEKQILFRARYRRMKNYGFVEIS